MRSTGLPCDSTGTFLPEGALPPPREGRRDPDDWFPWESEGQYRLTDFLYSKAQLSQGNVDELLRILPLVSPGTDASSFLYRNHKEMLSTIDKIEVRDVPWEHFSCRYRGEVSDQSPSWMKKSYTVHHRDPLEVTKQILANTSFAKSMDFAPYLDYDKNHV